MAKNDSKISAKKAVPGGVRKDVSFTKRSGTKTTAKGTRSNAGVEDYGQNKVGGHKAKVGDGAGTRSTAGLPPETEAMAAPAAEIPEAVSSLAADTLPVPDCYTRPETLGMIAGWDEARDAKMWNKGGK